MRSASALGPRAAVALQHDQRNATLSGFSGPVSSGTSRTLDAILQALISQAHDAANTVVLTVAGIFAERGEPTFRDAQTGLWAQYDPQALAAPEAFARDPDLVWSWCQWRRDLIRAVNPNAAHAALVDWQQHPELRIVTQNVDGLHERPALCALSQDDYD